MLKWWKNQIKQINKECYFETRQTYTLQMLIAKEVGVILTLGCLSEEAGLSPVK